MAIQFAAHFGAQTPLSAIRPSAKTVIPFEQRNQRSNENTNSLELEFSSHGDSVHFGRANRLQQAWKSEAVDHIREMRRKNSVSVYGSARTRPGDGYYEHAQKVAQAMGKAGFDVVTGGGPGAMRAVAEGASEYGVKSTGLAMNFIGEEPSADVHKKMRRFNDFFKRMDAFEEEAALSASVPGGIGTLMELTSIATKIDTNNTPWSMQRQIVLFDKNNVFRDFVAHLQDNFVNKGFMSQKTLNIFKIFDEDHIDDGVRLLKNSRGFTEAS